MSPRSAIPLSKLPNFDPKKIPALRKDVPSPLVQPHLLMPDFLRQRFATPPIWLPELVREIKLAEREPANAAVLIPLVMRGANRDRPAVLLTVRTEHLSTHSGQVAFPGGRTDDTDEDATATALREAQEEVGLEASYVEVIGTLPPYVTGTSFIITPVVALVSPEFTVTPNPFEVADVFEVPLAFLMDPANHRRHAFELEGVRREWYSMPYQDGGQERFIWGATAGILRNFYRFLSA